MILFKNVKIVPMTERNLVIEAGNVGVRNDKIVYVGEQMPDLEEYDRVIDCTGKVLLPALTNTHGHVPMTLLRGLGNGLPLERWLEERIYPAEAKLNGDMVYWGSLLAMAEMLACGTGSFTDMYFFSDAVAKATVESGMRGSIAKCLICFDPEGKNDDGRYEEAKALYDSYHGAGEGRVRIDMAFHAIYTTNPNYLSHTMEKMADLDTVVQFHLSETETEQQEALQKYGRTPARIFYDSGVMKKPCLAAHCVQLTEEDMVLLAENGVSVSTCPSSNLKLASGIPNVEKMLKTGINVSIGTDGTASNNNLNMFEEMHLTALLGKGLLHDPTVLDAYDVLHMATVGGAKAQKRADCGVIAEGQKADLILVDFDRPHLIPDADTIGNLVYSAQGSDVCLTMVNGKVLYENGTFATIDMERVKAEVRRAAADLIKTE